MNVTTIALFNISTIVFLFFVSWFIVYELSRHIKTLKRQNTNLEKLANIDIPMFDPSPEAKVIHTLSNKQCVYLLQDIEITGYVKIGKSRNPMRRLTDFGVKLPFKTVLVHVLVSENCSKLERALHRHYHFQRIRGEWFHLTQTDIDTIKQL
jgi:hypothetical protein